MRTEITYGYLGPVKIYSLCRVLRVMRVRTPKRNEFHLILGKNRTFPLFVLPLPAKYRCADRQNREALRPHEEVFARIDRARGEGKKVVLYVLDYLIEAGGVERRFELQFDWLEKHGVQPVLVCGRQEYAPLAHVPTILFRVDLLIGYFGSRHRLDEFFNRLPEKINPFSVQKHIIRPSD